MNAAESLLRSVVDGGTEDAESPVRSLEASYPGTEVRLIEIAL